MRGGNATQIGMGVLLLSFLSIYYYNWRMLRTGQFSQDDVMRLWRQGSSSSAYVDNADKRRHLLGLKRLHSIGFTPQHILDVGANVGEWARAAKQVFSDSEVMMVEGSETCDADLAKTGYRYLIALVGSSFHTSEYYETAKGTGNSLFLEKTKNFANVEPTLRRVFTLDSLMSGQPPVQFLKLDVQGAELDALKGASAILRSVEVILLELGILHFNAGAPLALDTLDYLRALGFDLLDIVGCTNMGRKDTESILGQVDMILARKGSVLFQKRAALVRVSG